MQASGFYPHMFQQALKQCEFPSCVVITFQVMAVAGVSPADPYPVGAVAESRKYEFRAYPAGTRHTDYPEMRRILKPADSGKIRRAVTAPVTEKTRDFRFPIVHRCLLSGPSRVPAFETGSRLNSYYHISLIMAMI
jgi:hypothetical protein